MKRVLYLVREIWWAVGSFGSRFLNAVIYGGSMNQTLSARCYVEAELTGGDWIARRDRINRLFFLQQNHCHRMWLAEVTRAEKTLKYNEMINPGNI